MNSQAKLLSALALCVAVQTAAAVITVQIGGATRLNSLSRQRDRYSCYWDCDLVGCQIARDDDECAYDCEKICRVRYDYAAAAVGRSSATSGAAEGAPASGAADQLSPKSGAVGEPAPASGERELGELVAAGTSVRLHMPRNASARNFAIWERCSPDAETGKVMEKPFNL